MSKKNGKKYGKKSLPRIERFDFQPGRVLGGKYRIDALLGGGWEGEVYGATERSTDIRRAIKVFYPHRNIRNRSVLFYAQKLHKLRDCSVAIQYVHSEKVRVRGHEITFLVSELVEGELLTNLLLRQRGKRLHPYEAMNLLYALARGLEQIHRRKEYHGDIHDENVLVTRRGIQFDVKLVDFYHWGKANRSKIREDVIQMVRMFYDAIGGRPHYAKQGPEIKAICRGLRRDVIAKQFPDAGALRAYLESFEWGR